MSYHLMSQLVCRDASAPSFCRLKAPREVSSPWHIVWTLELSPPPVVYPLLAWIPLEYLYSRKLIKTLYIYCTCMVYVWNKYTCSFVSLFQIIDITDNVFSFKSLMAVGKNVFLNLLVLELIDLNLLPEGRISITYCSSSGRGIYVWSKPSE